MSNPLADYRALQGAFTHVVAFKGRVLDLSKRVRVYRNLHAKTPAMRYSILQGGHVVAHAPWLVLSDVRFVISQAAWKRSLMLGHKVVCAFAEGTLVPTSHDIAALPIPVRFDRTLGQFRRMDTTEAQVVTAAACQLSERGMTITGAA